MNFGKMDRKVTIQKRSTTQNSKGEGIESWSDLTTVWAMKIERGGRDSFKAGVEESQRNTDFIMRYRSDVTADNLIIFEGQVYDIVRPPREIGRRAGLEISCLRRMG